MHLYVGVRDTLLTLKSRGVKIVAFTESLAFQTAYRIARLDLDGVLDAVYSPPDHLVPVSIDLDQVRTKPDKEYSLVHTCHALLERGAVKPDVSVLKRIMLDFDCTPEETAYVGDSLFKDIKMARDAGLLSVYAKYGVAQDKSGYDLLRRVSHWPDGDVAAEVDHETVPHPAITLEHTFEEILERVTFVGN